MKNKLKVIILLLLFYIPIVSADTTFCSASGVLKALRIVYYILTFLKILAPLFIIITGVVSFAKTLFEEKDNIKDKVFILIQKIFIGALIFLLPTCIYNIIDSFSFSKSLNDFAKCNECLFNTSSCDTLISTATINEQKKVDEYYTTAKKLKAAVVEAKKKEKEKSMKAIRAAIDAASTENMITGSFVGQKYNLSEIELLQIANQCYHEQGSPIGAAAEASLMANRFELLQSKYTSIHAYVKNSGWWAHSKTNMSGTPKVSSSVVDAVRQVLVYGNRTLPYYVDEHDCIKCGGGYDIVSATNNGVAIDRMDRSSYKSNVTILKNRYGATYTFYTFPTKNSDPFGYTANAYSKYQKMKG